MDILIDTIINFFPNVDPNNIILIDTFNYLADWVYLFKDKVTRIYYDYDSKTEEWTLARIPFQYTAHLAPEQVEEINKNKDYRYINSIKEYYPDVDPSNIVYVYKAFDFISIDTYYRDISTNTIYYRSHNKVWDIVTDTTNLFNTYEEFLADKQQRS